MQNSSMTIRPCSSFSCGPENGVAELGQQNKKKKRKENDEMKKKKKEKEERTPKVKKEYIF